MFERTSVMFGGMLSACDVKECNLKRTFPFPLLSAYCRRTWTRTHTVVECNLTQVNTWLQFISHLITLWPDHPADEQDGVCLLVLHQEDERVVSVEQFRVFQLVCAKDAGVNFVSVSVPFQCGGMEHIRQVQVLLPRDVGQVSFGFVHGLCQPQLPEVFLKGRKQRCHSVCKKEGVVIEQVQSFSVSCIFYLQVVTDFHADFGQR